MALTPELQAEYDLACRTFYENGGAITEEVTKLKPWRVFLEINSLCSLRCPSCTKGSKDYEHKTGVMDWSLMERILDKIKSENPNAVIFLYGNSEGFLHPKLPECVAAVRSRGLHPEISTNLNYVRRVDELLAAKPDLIIISLSGFTQEVYVKGHVGGDIEKVKANMRIIAEANNRIPLENRVNIQTNFHVYKGNEHEIPLMKEYCKNLGIGFFTSFARAISMENSLQYCRSVDPDAPAYEVQEGRPDWNHLFPPISETYKSVVSRMHIPPTKAREMYADKPSCNACPIGGMFIYIHYDGLMSLCACVADRRINLGQYLDHTQDEFITKRTGHAICKMCNHYRMREYFHIVDREKWVSPT